MRASTPVGTGVHAMYSAGVSERKVNRDEWAKIVDGLLRRHTRGNKSALARDLKVDVRTISRWLNSEVDVSEDSVREVARVYSLAPMQLLVNVGYYRLGELLPSPTEGAGARDEEMELILTADVSDEMKKRMIALLVEQRERDKARRIEDIRWRLERGA